MVRVFLAHPVYTDRKSTSSFLVSLRWTRYVAPKNSRDSMTEVTVFRLKLHFSRRKSVAKFIYVKTVSSKVVSYSLANLTVKKWLVLDVAFYLKFQLKLTHPLKNAKFQSIFACSASAVTFSEKNSIMTNRKTRFPMSLRWTASVPPKALHTTAIKLK